MKPRCSARGMLGCVLLALGAVLLMLPGLKALEAPEPVTFSASGRTAEVSEILPQQGSIPVNSAGAAELDELPGVGEAISQRILEEREANGLFFYPEDLMQVSGIGEKKLEDMRDMLDLTEEETMDLGIIGGADGPTAILVSSSQEGWVLLGAIIVALAVGAVYWIVQNKRKGD